jgi:hypothetical protein
MWAAVASRVAHYPSALTCILIHYRVHYCEIYQKNKNEFTTERFVGWWWFCSLEDPKFENALVVG